MNITPTYTGPLKHRYKSIIAYPAAETGGARIVEIGPGRGDFLFHLAETNPDRTVYGIEIKSKRFEKLIQRREARKLHNIKLILADATEALPQIFDDSSVDAIYINFPDPWPKRRHTKNRILNPAFLNDCGRILAPNGSLSITTDVESYARETFENLKVIDELSPTTADITTESDDAYPTLFSEKWKAASRTIYYQKYTRAPRSRSNLGRSNCKLLRPKLLRDRQ